MDEYDFNVFVGEYLYELVSGMKKVVKTSNGEETCEIVITKDDDGDLFLKWSNNMDGLCPCGGDCWHYEEEIDDVYDAETLIGWIVSGGW